jgi:hypothetical protein
MLEISINESNYTIKLESELENKINLIAQKQFAEIWISGHGTSALCVLKNNHQAFLLYLRENRDSGFCSRNKEGNETKLIEFKLSNGQYDEYPENWVVPYEKAKKALAQYFLKGKKPSNIIWKEN